MARAAVVLGFLLAAVPAAAQDRPVLRLDVRATDPPEVAVSVQELFSERAFLDALESGFPLYMEYHVALRAPRPLWDRTADEVSWDYVVLYDPVRERFAVETPDGTEILPDRRALRDRLARVYFVGLTPDGAGTFYYEAEVRARTLSDEDVNETFAWLKGNNGDSARLRSPGFLTRVARKVLIQVAPLPSLSLSRRTPDLRWR